MARARGEAEASGNPNHGNLDRFIETLGQRIGVQLGKVIAAHLQRTIEGSVDLGAVARRVGRGGRGGQAAQGKGACGEPGCGQPVLAKALCRSHYYRARYQAQKDGGRKARKPRRAAKNGAGNGSDANP